MFYAPVRLPDGSFGIAQAELRTAAGDKSRRAVHWPLFDRFGQLASRELDLPAVAFGQAFAHVERLLREQGIRFNVGDRGKK